MSKKTTVCKKCNTEVASKEKFCSNCGAKIKKPIYKKPIIWIIAALVLIIIIAAASSGGGKNIDYSNPDFKITADEFMNEYSSNAVAADGKYKDKLIEVSGKLSSINDSTLRLEGYADENWLTNVVVYPAAGQEDKILNLKNGSDLTVIGICDSTDIFSDIMLKEAIIQSDKTSAGESDKETEAVVKEENTEKPSKETVTATEVDIDELLDDYSNNSVAADKKYKNVELTLTNCKIYSIEENHIQLEGSDEWAFSYVYAYYSSDVDVTSLSKGDYITITGTCKGEEFLGIKMANCSIK